MRDGLKSSGGLPAAPTLTIESQTPMSGIDGEEEAMRAYAKQLSILNRIILLGNKAQDVDSLLDQILETTLDLMNCDGGGIYLVDDANRVAEIRTARGLPRSFLEKVERVKMDEWPYSIVLVDKTPLITDLFETYLPEISIEAGLESLASVPLLASEKVIGALNVATRQRNAFTEEQCKILESIGREAGTVIVRMQAEEELRHRDAILEAVSTASEKLLRAPCWETCIQEILGKLGQAGRVSRVYIFENREAADGTLLVGQRFEWTDEGVAPQMNNPDVQDFPWIAGGMGRWVDPMLRGEVIQGHVRDFPESEQAILAPQGIQSILAVPIFVEERWWGFIGFDECSRGREWSRPEVKALRMAGDILGAAIQRSRAERELATSEARYRAVVEDQTEFICRFLPDGTLTFVSTAYCGCFEETSKQLIGQKFWHHVLEEDRERLEEHIASLSRENPVAVIEQQIVMASGDIRWHQWTDRAIFDEKGSIVEYQGVGRDITEQKTAQLAIQRLEEKYRLLVENANEIILVAQDDRIKFSNPKATEFTGYSQEQLASRPFIEFVHPDDREMLLANYEKKLKGLDAPGKYSFRYFHNDGEVLWGELNSALINWEGRPALLTMITDVTARKKTEEALRYLSSRLLLAQEEERKRIAGELHDSIGQTLAAMKFSVENAIEKTSRDRPEEVFKLLDLLVPIIRNAIEETRSIYMGLRPSILDDLGILATINWFCRDFQKIYPGHYLEVETDVEEHEIPEDLKIVIFRVLQEALNNMAKHSRAELANISLLKREKWIELMIEDNGEGFDSSDIASQRVSGRGLGLSSMQERAELSGGTFSIESTIGEGTIIRASWPLER